MKKKGLRGAKEVFRFTIQQQMRQQGWRLSAILPALILLLGIPAILLIVDHKQNQIPDSTAITAVCVWDETGKTVDYSVLNSFGDSVYSQIRYLQAENETEAFENAESDDTMLILHTEWADDAFQLSLIKPEDTALKGKEVRAYADFLNTYFRAVAVLKADISPVILQELSTPVQSASGTTEAYRKEQKQDGYEEVRYVLLIALPYLCVMLLYFMVLIYGQSVAGNVILEKSNKLMDTMLISMEPQGMILGKTLACSLAGILQLVCWIGGLVLGCIIGKSLVLSLNPDSDMAIIQFFELIGKAGGMFELSNVVFGILILLAGFLMYCAIGSIGGALASRPEELGNCNGVFTILLVASFLLTMYGETDSSSTMVSNAAWMNYVPFTAVLCTPARAMLGQVTTLTCIAALVLIMLVSLAAVVIAGRLYRVLTFRKGAAPKLRDIPRLIRMR